MQMLYLSFLQAEMAKRNSVGSHDMPRQNAFRPAYGTAQDSDDVRIISLIILLLIIIHFMVQLHTAFEGYILEKKVLVIFSITSGSTEKRGRLCEPVSEKSFHLCESHLKILNPI